MASQSSRTVVKSLRVEPALWAKVEAGAKAEGMNINAFVTQLIMERFKIDRVVDAGTGAVVAERRRAIGFDRVTGAPIYETHRASPKVAKEAKKR